MSLAFQIYKKDFRTFLAQLVSTLRVKLYKVVIRGKIYIFLNLWALLLKRYHFCVCDIFFSPSGYPINSIFQYQYVFIRCLWWSIFPLNYQNAYGHQQFQAGAQPAIFQGRGGFVKLGHFDKHLIKKSRKNAPRRKILEFFLLDKITFWMANLT